ncbi:uncharacterized protein LOC135377262 [Ornithodoros turicata]|uniref:uncharacterized protein LOC135377262 n=1 Tax=Ornithodoros turicata TaxID=34597 RepID=UPI003139D1E6
MIQVALQGVRCQYQLKVSVQRCTALKRPAHGGVRCSRDRQWGSRCHFYCYPGYHMERISTTCIRMGNNMQWTSHATPFCQEIPLVEAVLPTTPSSVPSTSTSTTTTTSMTTTSTTTPQVTTFQRMRQMACRWPRDRRWLRCNRKSIVAPEGSVCSYRCPRGRTTKLVCIAGTWRIGPRKGCPPCTAATSKQCTCPKWRVTSCANVCKGLPQVAHGRLKCVSGERSPGARCSYACYRGYVIPKSQRSRNAFLCLETGQWNHTSLPQCASKKGFPKLTSGCRTEVILASTMPVLLPAPLYEGFNIRPSVECTIARVESFGFYVNQCRATDLELGTSATCTYNVTVVAPGCPAIKGDPFSQVRCSNGGKDLQPVGTICEYICQLGYVIPKSKQEWAVKECFANGSWSNNYFSLCERRVEPVPVGGCEDVTVYTDEPSSVKPRAPTFQTAAGMSATVQCSANIRQFGSHPVTCRGLDEELGTSASCTFQVVVKGATEPRVPGGCVPQDSEAGEPVPVPRFLTVQGEGATVRCKPEQAPLLAGIYNVTCKAHDERTGAHASCTYALSVRPGKDVLEKQALVAAPYLQGTIAFSVGVPSCSMGSIPEGLLPMVQNVINRKTSDLCGRLRCLPIDAQCKTSAMSILFRFQAEYSTLENLSEAEDLVEQLQRRMYEIVTKDEDFATQASIEGGHLWPHSFDQRPLTVACTNPGFIARDGTLCVACDEGTFEEKGGCYLCPSNFYQDRKGQTKCKECPKLKFSNAGAKSVNECRE